MNLETVTLRLEEPSDEREVESVIRDAFWNQYEPGCSEHYLAHLLRLSPDFVPELDLLAEAGGRIVGSILYTRAHILLDAGGKIPVLSFGPLAVRPDVQRLGIGGRLIRSTQQLARESGARAILIYGDPAYYSRYDFVPAETYRIGTPQNQYLTPLQAYELWDGALADTAGRFVESSVFDQLDPDRVAEFDRQFPPREKLEGTPGQKRFQETLKMIKPRVI